MSERPSVDEILSMNPKEFAEAWENGDIHRAWYDYMGIPWEEIPEDQQDKTD